MEVIGESKNEIDLLKGVVDALYDTGYHIVILGIIDEGILKKMERRSPFSCSEREIFWIFEGKVH